ncbi:hypothetical protein GPECTOR_8g224 [Gonium pectorale]|uniref:Uncharacterized protein n=1 Tax=Gonium pectorale TaxID=33097 RepID=A0A150GSQ4_GONPE|nr:hypothetical protein GPECTOR_8g224 [Gonium pectorale]|eukprot:KXZ52841.1 hypothetical protein GPECTOR_8g224 [Gonium pectorale]
MAPARLLNPARPSAVASPAAARRPHGPARPCLVTRAAGSTNGTDGAPKPQKSGSGSDPGAAKPATSAKPAESLNLAFESDKKLVTPPAAGKVIMESPVKTTGLHRAPLSGGVKTATTRYELPTPPVAVRNLVEHARFGHLCTMMSGMHHRRASPVATG